jgi:DNA-directed RNA polymerase subunit alpha
VKRVHYEVENTRVGQRIDFDKLTLEVWTDGTVTPEDAVSFAAKLLKDHLLLWMNFEVEPEEEEEEIIDEDQMRLMEILNHGVDELELSVRSSNCLRDAGIRTLGDLVQKSEAEMLKYRNFGRKSLQELVDILADMGLHFGMDVSELVEPGAPRPDEEDEEADSVPDDYEPTDDIDMVGVEPSEPDDEDAEAATEEDEEEEEEEDEDQML